MWTWRTEWWLITYAHSHSLSLMEPDLESECVWCEGGRHIMLTPCMRMC